jgi:hypothetical protein
MRGFQVAILRMAERGPFGSPLTPPRHRVTLSTNRGAFLCHQPTF